MLRAVAAGVTFCSSAWPKWARLCPHLQGVGSDRSGRRSGTVEWHASRWTREYLEKKFAALRKANVANLILCVDAERGCSEGDLPLGARVVRFKRRIDPAAVLAFASQAVS
jgi:predicted nuclease of restriction endonuclease-like RecB superfamily